MPQALDWLRVARDCFADERGTLRRGLLGSVFALVIGLERRWHLDEMEDVGFALLTGGRCCPSRHTVGAGRRHLAWYEVDAFCRRTSPWHLVEGADVLGSYDEHTIPRWAHKFPIKKGQVTTRNKDMRCEKLFYTFEVLGGRYLAVRATPGDTGLIDRAAPLARPALVRGQPAYRHALFDAAAGHADAGARALGDLVEQEHPRLDVTLRACRYRHRVRGWKALERGRFVPSWEPGPYAGAPPKDIHLAETTTVLKDERPGQAVRTLVCREIVPGPQKGRRHPLFTTSQGEADEVRGLFRQRQHHGQAYRVGAYDECPDSVPCGYDKQSPDPKRPRWQRGPLRMIGWLVALVYNACADFAEALEGDGAGCHVRALRRTFFNRPGQLCATPEALIVCPDPLGDQEALVSVIDAFNAAGHRIPWLDNRRLVMSLTPQHQQRAGP